MSAIISGLHDVVESLVKDILATMEGIPEEDLNTWKPAAEQNGGGAMNTFAAVGVHTASAGKWMLLHQVLGEDVSRNREGEFEATATMAEIRAGFDDLLGVLRDRADDLAATDLSLMPPTIRDNHPTWTRAAWLLHLVDHTGIHLGHLQIHRQLWDAERNAF